MTRISHTFLYRQDITNCEKSFVVGLLHLFFCNEDDDADDPFLRALTSSPSLTAYDNPVQSYTCSTTSHRSQSTRWWLPCFLRPKSAQCTYIRWWTRYRAFKSLPTSAWMDALSRRRKMNVHTYFNVQEMIRIGIRRWLREDFRSRE